jgi:hypothetical protein
MLDIYVDDFNVLVAKLADVDAETAKHPCLRIQDPRSTMNCAMS